MFVTFCDQSWLLGCPVPHTFGSGALASALNTRGLDFPYLFVKKGNHVIDKWVFTCVVILLQPGRWEAGGRYWSSKSLNPLSVPAMITFSLITNSHRK